MSAFHLEGIAELAQWQQFECWLRTPGPWIAGLDFPFGLPREAVQDLGLPQAWPQLVAHVRQQTRHAFRAQLDRYRESRPFGRRYAHRAADYPAGSHSPLKLVNPPVGLMFLEGAPRLLDAGLSIPGLHNGDPLRIAVEAYPGFVARQILRLPYKNDAVAKQTAARHRARSTLLGALTGATGPFEFRLTGSPRLLNTLTQDATGDRLDAVFCAMQAAWAWQRREDNYGLPPEVDPVEGWIAMVGAGGKSPRPGPI